MAKKPEVVAQTLTATQTQAIAAFMAQMGLAIPAPAPAQAADKAAPAPAQAADKAAGDAAAVSKLLAGAKLVEFRTTAKKGIVYAVCELPVNSSGRAQRITVYI